MEVFVDDQAKLRLEGLMQHYVKIEEQGKNRKLLNLLDKLEFNQVYYQGGCVSDTVINCCYH